MTSKFAAVGMAPAIIGGVIIGGFGLKKCLKAKVHVDEICNKIFLAKTKLINDTNGEHHHRPGDIFIRHAFEGLTEKYFGKIQNQWQNDL